MGDISGKVLAVEQLTDRISEFRLGASDGAPLPEFCAGAHIRVDIGERETRAYSLIEFTPHDASPQEYRIAVQLEPEGAGGSQMMHRLHVDDPVAFSAPKNDFPLDDAERVVLIAGGIGITPMISMVAELSAQGRLFDLHYSGRSRKAMTYVETLAALCGQNLQLHVDDTPDTALDLEQIVGSLSGAHLYLCGPRGMIDAARSAAEAAGVPASQIHIELFESSLSVDSDAAFEVEIASTGAVYQVAPGQSIIDALEDGGVDVMYDCRRGDCGICQCDVISGTPDHRDVVLSQEERASGKVMQICVSRAKSARLVLDI